MGPCGSVRAHIKTGRSPMAHEHFQTPPDPQRAFRIQFESYVWLFVTETVSMIWNQKIDFENSRVLFDFLDSNFPDFQIVRFLDVQAVSWQLWWPSGLRSHLDLKMLIFYFQNLCLSNGRPNDKCNNLRFKQWMTNSPQ